jgi:hypothetical protein
MDAIRKAVRMHPEGMREYGLTIPVPTASADYLQAV